MAGRLYSLSNTVGFVHIYYKFNEISLGLLYNLTE